MLGIPKYTINNNQSNNQLDDGDLRCIKEAPSPNELETPEKTDTTNKPKPTEEV
jgi:hypothetical protein